MYLLAAVLLAGRVACRAADKVCTSLSGSTVSWKMLDFDFHSWRAMSSPTEGTGAGFVNFTLQNTALVNRFACEAASARTPDFFYAGDVYECRGSLADPGDKTSFSFDRAKGLLHIDQEWVCERDGSRFVGVGEVRLDPNWNSLLCYAHPARDDVTATCDMSERLVEETRDHVLRCSTGSTTDGGEHFRVSFLAGQARKYHACIMS